VLATHAPSLTNAGACLQGPAAAAPPPPKKDDDAEDDSKFDEFMGADTALLAGTTGEYDKDDKEADEIWAHVDDFMDDRRRVRSHLPAGWSSAWCRLSTAYWSQVSLMQLTQTWH
jgi:PRP1 splicing factor, N-terminal